MDVSLVLPKQEAENAEESAETEENETENISTAVDVEFILDLQR